MKKGVVIVMIIVIIIIIVIIGAVSVYFMINQNSNTANKITPPDAVPKPTGVNHSIELSEGITMTAP